MGISILTALFATGYLLYRNLYKKEPLKKEVIEFFDGYAQARQFMVEHHLKGRDIYDETVLRAMNTVPREKFVLEQYVNKAYQDSALPINYGQTISQPYIVALMTALVKPDKNDIALEIGTGSGYQAAVLSEIVKKVYTIEIVPPLGKEVKNRLNRLDYDNIETKIGDGYYGWEEHAPYDCIIVTAAVDHIPPPLIKQLKKGGKMAIPVGHPFLTQHLTLVEKSDEGEIKTRNMLAVRFVPFLREGEYTPTSTDLY